LPTPEAVGDHAENYWRPACAAYSPDGKLIATGDASAVVRVWDADSGKLLRNMEGHRGAIQALAFSPDGHRLASGGRDGHLINLWDVPSGRLTLTLRGHASSVEAIDFSPNGHWIVSASGDHTLKVWDASPIE